MPYEHEPSRPASRAPLGCIVLFLLVVALGLAVLVVLAIAWQPRFPGADPF